MQAFQRDMDGVRSVLGEPQEVTVATVSGCDKLVDWMNVFRLTQASFCTQNIEHFTGYLTGDRTWQPTAFNTLCKGCSTCHSLCPPQCHVTHSRPDHACSLLVYCVPSAKKNTGLRDCTLSTRGRCRFRREA